jgi:hypothetical protein
MLAPIAAALTVVSLGLVVGIIRLGSGRPRRGGTVIPEVYRPVHIGGLAATTAARELLMRLLTPEQREDYRAMRQFSVQTDIAHYKLVWGSRVLAKRHGVDRSICIIFADPGTLPEEDRLIAILLMIRTDEEKFWRRLVPLGQGVLIGAHRNRVQALGGTVT